MADLEKILETGRLRLEPIRVAHAPAMFEILSDRRLHEYIPREAPLSPDLLAQRYARLESRRSPGGDELWMNWAVCSRSRNLVLGNVQATIRPGDRAWLAYELGTAWLGRGYATEACRRVIESLFEDHGVTRIIAEVDTRNAASIRLLERLGFQRGALKENADFFKGARSDELTYNLER